MRGFSRILVIIAVIVFLLARQIYVNLLGVDRTLISALFALAISGFGLYVAWLRSRVSMPSFWIFDLIVWTEFFICLPVIVMYSLSGRMDVAQTTYAILYYCFIPLLVYAVFWIKKLDAKILRQIETAICGVFLLMVVAGVTQALGLDLWLFRNDRYFLQPTSLGFQRATGAYGTQIDFGALCFIFFAYSFFRVVRNKAHFHIVVAAAAVIGVVLALSRFYIAATIVLLLLWFVGHLKLQDFRKPLSVFAVALVIGTCVAGFRYVNITSVLLQGDEYTESSNESRLEYVRSIPKLATEFLAVGAGPGTQNGPNGIRDDVQKIVTDFLWLSFFVEYGFIVGGVIAFLKLAALLLMFSVYRRKRHPSALANTVMAISVTFLLCSFVNSAFANATTIGIFYVMGGLFAFEVYENRSAELLNQTAV
jgi:hypothetical protein